jgi:hypothetical protein
MMGQYKQLIIKKNMDTVTARPRHPYKLMCDAIAKPPKPLYNRRPFALDESRRPAQHQTTRP